MQIVIPLFSCIYCINMEIQHPLFSMHLLSQYFHAFQYIYFGIIVQIEEREAEAGRTGHCKHYSPP